MSPRFISFSASKSDFTGAMLYLDWSMTSGPMELGQNQLYGRNDGF